MHQEITVFPNRIGIFKSVHRDTLGCQGLQELDHRRMGGSPQMVRPIGSQSRFELSIAPDNVGQFQIGIEGDSIPSFPTLTSSVIGISLKLRVEKVGSRLCSEVLSCDSRDPLDTLLPFYHTRTPNCSMHWRNAS